MQRVVQFIVADTKVDVIFSELLLSLTKNVSDKSSFEED